MSKLRNPTICTVELAARGRVQVRERRQLQGAAGQVPGHHPRHARAHQADQVQYSTVQYSTVQYSTAQYSTVQYSTVIQYSAVQCSTVQYIQKCNQMHASFNDYL